MRIRSILFVLGVVAILVIGLALFFSRSLLQQMIFARTPAEICLRVMEAPVCYRAPETLPVQMTTAIAVSPNGKFLVSSSRANLQVWDLETGVMVRSWQAHEDWISALAISPGNQWVASSSLDQTTRLWDLPSGQLLNTLDTGRVTSLEFSPDGDFLATGSRTLQWADGQTSEGGVFLWERSTGNWVDRFGTAPISAISFSPDGQWIASGGNKTHLWQRSEGELLHELNSGRVTALSFSPDSQVLITGSSRIKFWRVPSGEIQEALVSGASDLAIHPEGSTMVTSAGGVCHLWEISTARWLGSLRGSWYSGLFVEFGLKGQALVAAGSDGIRIWRSEPADPLIGSRS